MRYAQNTEGTTQDGVLQALTDLIAELRAGNTSGSTFRRLREPYLIPVGLEASRVEMDAEELRRLGVTSFGYVNKNPFFVRLKGSNKEGGFKPVTLTTGWCWRPLSERVYATQYPDFVSAIAEHTDAHPIVNAKGALLPGITFRPIELFYGFGA